MLLAALPGPIPLFPTSGTDVCGHQHLLLALSEALNHGSSLLHHHFPAEQGHLMALPGQLCRQPACCLPSLQHTASPTFGRGCSCWKAPINLSLGPLEALCLLSFCPRYKLYQKEDNHLCHHRSPWLIKDTFSLCSSAPWISLCWRLTLHVYTENSRKLSQNHNYSAWKMAGSDLNVAVKSHRGSAQPWFKQLLYSFLSSSCVLRQPKSKLLLQTPNTFILSELTLPGSSVLSALIFP